MTDYNKLLYKLKKYNNYSNISKFNKYNSRYKTLYGGNPDGIEIPKTVINKDISGDTLEIQDIKKKYTTLLNKIDPTTLTSRDKKDYDKISKDIHIIPGLYESLIRNVFNDTKTQAKFIEDNDVSREVLRLFHLIDEKLVSRKAYDEFYEDVKSKAGLILQRLQEILRRLELAKQKYFDTLVELEYYKLGISPKEPDCNEDLLNLLKVIREYILLRSNINEVKFDIDMFNPTLTSIEQVLDMIDASKLNTDAKFKVAEDLYDKLVALNTTTTTPKILDISGRKFDITDSTIPITLPTTKPTGTSISDADKNNFSDPILELVTKLIQDPKTKPVTPTPTMPGGGYRDNINYIQLMLNYQEYL